MVIKTTKDTPLCTSQQTHSTPSKGGRLLQLAVEYLCLRHINRTLSLAYMACRRTYGIRLSPVTTTYIVTQGMHKLHISPTCIRGALMHNTNYIFPKCMHGTHIQLQPVHIGGGECMPTSGFKWSSHSMSGEEILHCP